MTVSTVVRAPLRRLAFGLLGALACCAAANATPVTYVGTVTTDISLNGVKYHHADVTISFHGDTDDLTPIHVTAPDGISGGGLILQKGSATLSFETQGRTRRANFVDGQLFVSVDSENGGIGFGAFTGPGGLEVAYPLAYSSATAEDFSNAENLSTEVSVSGHAWSCIGYPPAATDTSPGQCASPDAWPLKTDRGDFMIYQPYNYIDGINGGNSGRIRSDYHGTMTVGTFSILAH